MTVTRLKHLWKVNISCRPHFSSNKQCNVRSCLPKLWGYLNSFEVIFIQKTKSWLSEEWSWMFNELHNIMLFHHKCHYCWLEIIICKTKHMHRCDSVCFGINRRNTAKKTVKGIYMNYMFVDQQQILLLYLYAILWNFAVSKADLLCPVIAL